jgi:hypothetical protein
MADLVDQDLDQALLDRVANGRSVLQDGVRRIGQLEEDEHADHLARERERTREEVWKGRDARHQRTQRDVWPGRRGDTQAVEARGAEQDLGVIRLLDENDELGVVVRVAYARERAVDGLVDTVGFGRVDLDEREEQQRLGTGEEPRIEALVLELEQ